MARILIADDHALVRAGYRQFLQSEPGLDIVEAGDGEEALERLESRAVDLVLLDMQMPGQWSGLPLQNEIRVRFPEVRVLVMSGLPTNNYARLVMRAGAMGYLSKSINPLEVVRAVRMVLAGRRYVSPELAQLLAEDLQRGSVGAPHERLSAREFEVMYQLSSGARLTDVATDLGLSVKTVSTYRRRLLEKLSMSTNVELTAYVFHNKLAYRRRMATAHGDRPEAAELHDKVGIATAREG